MNKSADRLSVVVLVGTLLAVVSGSVAQLGKSAVLVATVGGGILAAIVTIAALIRESELERKARNKIKGVRPDEDTTNHGT